VKAVIRLFILDKDRFANEILHFIYHGRVSWHVWFVLHSRSP